ncbi:4-sulfomuconolactone hydrolase [compost metagenome]
MALGQGGHLWMKVSGIYRLGATAPQNLEFARASLTLLEHSFGPERLVWGSDWPHTQHEEHVGFETVMGQLRALECSASLMQALLVQAPQALFRF